MDPLLCPPQVDSKSTKIDIATIGNVAPFLAEPHLNRARLEAMGYTVGDDVRTHPHHDPMGTGDPIY